MWAADCLQQHVVAKRLVQASIACRIGAKKPVGSFEMTMITFSKSFRRPLHRQWNRQVRPIGGAPVLPFSAPAGRSARHDDP